MICAFDQQTKMLHTLFIPVTLLAIKTFISDLVKQIVTVLNMHFLKQALKPLSSINNLTTNINFKNETVFITYV